MRISSLEEYGLRCMLALARQGTQGQLSISDIADLEGLSVPYASKLLAILRKSGLVTAVRGRSGGFCITREPHQINLLEVMTALGGPLIDPDHCVRFKGQLDACVHSDNCSVHHVLDSLALYISDILSRTTLDDLIKRTNTTPAVQPGFIAAESLLSEPPDATDITAARAEDGETRSEKYKQQSI